MITLRAELFGVDTIVVAAEEHDVSVTHKTPILAACRKLEAMGYSEASMHVYRGDTKVLTVPNIGVAAQWTIIENEKTGPKLAKYVPFTGINSEASVS